MAHHEKLRRGNSWPPPTSKAPEQKLPDVQGFRHAVRAEIHNALRNAGIQMILMEIRENQQRCLTRMDEWNAANNAANLDRKRISRKQSDSSLSLLSAGTNVEPRPSEPVETVQALAEKRAGNLIRRENLSCFKAGSRSPSPPRRRPSNRLPRAKTVDWAISPFHSKAREESMAPPAHPPPPPESSATMDLVYLMPGAMGSFVQKPCCGRGEECAHRTTTRTVTGTCRSTTVASRCPSTQPDSEEWQCAGTIDLTSVRQGQERALTSVFVNEEGSDGPNRFASGSLSLLPCLGFGSLPIWLQWVFYMSGVVPGKSYIVWVLRRGIMLTFVLACAIMMVGDIYCWSPTEGVRIHLNVEDVLCGFGAVVGLISLRWEGMHFLVSHSRSPLEEYAHCYGFLDLWRGRSSHFSLGVFSFCLLDVLCRLSAGILFDERFNMLATGMAVFSTVLFGCLIAFQLHICEALAIMVDDFCTQFFKRPNVSRGISEWNTLQATLRQAGRSIESCCLLLPTSAVAAIFLDGATVLLSNPDEENMAHMFLAQILPGMMKVTLAVFAFHRAATVSEKCMQAPALVNSIKMPDAEDELDPDRQYLVQYMEHSAAGFYIKGVRINSFMVMKVSYALASAMLILSLKATNNGLMK